MKRSRSLTLFAAAAAVSGLWLAACAGNRSVARSHPEKVQGAPVCSECHAEWQGAYDHGPGFTRGHRFYASGDQRVCDSCHRPSFCSECHADKEELKPSDKHRDAPFREMPHRGDYLTQHRIDGKLDPASCFRCHGRKNDWRCGECHR